MPSTSGKQKRFMAAAANNPDFAKRAGIKQSVAREFHGADYPRRKKMQYGGRMGGLAQMARGRFGRGKPRPGGMMGRRPAPPPGKGPGMQVPPSFPGQPPGGGMASGQMVPPGAIGGNLQNPIYGPGGPGGGGGMMDTQGRGGFNWQGGGGGGAPPGEVGINQPGAPPGGGGFMSRLRQMVQQQQGQPGGAQPGGGQPQGGGLAAMMRQMQQQQGAAQPGGGARPGQPPGGGFMGRRPQQGGLARFGRAGGFGGGARGPQQLGGGAGGFRGRIPGPGGQNPLLRTAGNASQQYGGRLNQMMGRRGAGMRFAGGGKVAKKSNV